MSNKGKGHPQHKLTQIRVASGRDIIEAKAGLAMNRDLPQRAIQVGTALLEHYNRKSGRCDPAIDTIAKGLRRSRSTVIRGLNDLTNGDQPHFWRRTHGGTCHTNSYDPNLPILKAPLIEYQHETGIRKPTSQQCHGLEPEQSQDVTGKPCQPLTPKPIEKTKEVPLKDGNEKGKKDLERSKQMGGPIKRLDRLGLSKDMTSKRTAMTEAAQRRITKDIQKEGLHNLYEMDIEYPGAWERAIIAEATTKGDGIIYLKELYIQTYSRKG